MFKLAEGKPLYLCLHWLETVELEEKPELSSERISNFLHELSKERASMFKFFTAWSVRNKDANRFIVFDITSFSSYGNVLTELNILSLGETTFVLDKGFYSSANLSKMKEIEHIIPLPKKSKKERELVGKCFDALKNNLPLKRLRIHSRDAMEGLLFIQFIALILYSHISKVLRESGLNTTLSIPEVLFELQKIKKISFGRKKTMITKISKQQRRIL